MTDWMRVIAWTIAITILFVYTSRSSRADDYSIRFGPSIQNGSTDGSSKQFGMRYESELADSIYLGGELGGFVDTGGKGRKGSGVAKFQIGVKPGPKVGVYGFGFFGPCGITSPDSQLGSRYQFATDIGLGVRDLNTFMSVGYGHISNAGLKLPNHGRDVLLFTVGVSL